MDRRAFLTGAAAAALVIGLAGESRGATKITETPDGGGRGGRVSPN